MKKTNHKDITPWLLLPSVVLALSSVTLLAPHQAALAGPVAASKAAPPKAALPAAEVGPVDDDGDELLEHWGDPQFSNEQQKQMAGMAAGFLLLGAAAAVRRTRRKSRLEIVPLPSEAEFLKLAPQAGPGVPLILQEHSETQPHSDTRKAA